MKNDVMPSIVQMEYGVLENLMKEVKETLATDIKITGPTRRSFGINDLWKIRRTAKQASNRFRG